jgi:hypothetical protein
LEGKKNGHGGELAGEVAGGLNKGRRPSPVLQSKAAVLCPLRAFCCVVALTAAGPGLAPRSVGPPKRQCGATDQQAHLDFEDPGALERAANCGRGVRAFAPTSCRFTPRHLTRVSASPQGRPPCATGARHCNPVRCRPKSAESPRPSLQRAPSRACVQAFAIWEPVLTQHLLRQFFVDVWRYQFAKCKRGRVILSLAAAGSALW